MLTRCFKNIIVTQSCVVLLTTFNLATDAYGQVDFDTLNVATKGFGLPGRDKRSMLMDAYQGKIYFVTFDDTPPAPGKINVYDPADGQTNGLNHTVLMQHTDSFSALRSVVGLLYIATEGGLIFTFDGMFVTEVTNTPFSSGNFVLSMCEFGDKAFFGTSTGDVYRYASGTWTTVFLSSNRDVTSLAVWNGGFYGTAKASSLHARDAILFSSSTGDSGSWTVTAIQPGVFGEGILVPTPDHLQLGVVDNENGYLSSVRRSTDGTSFPTVEQSTGQYKHPFDGVFYEGFSYVSFDKVGASNNAYMIQDDGTNTSRIVTDNIVMQMLVLDGYVYTAQLDTNGGFGTPGDVLIMTNAPVQLPDSDGDGVPDEEDDCPDSDLGPSIVIDECDTEVENEMLDDGCTMADLIMQCADGAVNHGAFVRCVSHLANLWKCQGLINGQQKGAIMSCAGQANLP